MEALRVDLEPERGGASTVPDTQYEVILPQLDDRQRYHAAKILMEWLDLGWAEARDLVARHPIIAACGSNHDRAEAVRAALAEVGINATVQEVDAKTLREHLFLAATATLTSEAPSGPTYVRRAFWWALVMVGLPFVLWLGLDRLGLYNVPRAAGEQLNLEVQINQNILDVRNQTAITWRTCAAKINDFYAREVAELPAGRSVFLSTEDFVGPSGQRYSGPSEQRPPIIAVSMSCDDPPGSWRRTF